MENLIVCIAFYVLFIALAYSPKSNVVPQPTSTAPIDYFPEVKEVTQAKPKTQSVNANLSTLGVRELYQVAATAGVKGYKKMSKVKLIQSLRGLETALMV